MGKNCYFDSDYVNLVSFMNHWFSGETNMEWKLLVKITKMKRRPIPPIVSENLNYSV